MTIDQTSKNKDFYFTIFELLKKGLYPAKISKKLNISKQRANFYIRKLKKDGIIEKKGYGVWEVKTSKTVGGGGLGVEVRGHGFAYKIPIKNLRNWERRQELLEKRGIPIEPSQNKVTKLLYKGHKIWLTDHSIIVYFPKNTNFYAETSEKAQKQAELHLKTLCFGLFRFIGINLGKTECQIIKHHYALVGNALAHDYNKRKEKLMIEMHNKVWALIDFSEGKDEFETISISADKDNKKVQDFFNGIKRYDGFTPEFLMNSLGGVVMLQKTFNDNIVGFGDNLNSHLSILNKLGLAVDGLTEQVKKIAEVVEKGGHA